MTPWERYFLMGRRAGCPKDQMQRFERADVILQERQLVASAAARLCDRADGPTAIGYGGARGGGKSHWLLAQMGVDDCQRVPGLKCLLLRKVGKANLEHFEDLRRKLFTNLGHEFSAFALRLDNDAREQMRQRLVLGDGIPAFLIGALLGVGQRLERALPGARGHAVVGTGEIRFGDLQIKRGLTNGVVLGVNDLLGFVLVGGLETGAFAGGFIHAIVHSTADAAVS